MDNPFEIIVSLREDPGPTGQFRIVPFEELSQIRDRVRSLTFLWNTNCYHVNVDERTFIINGGRRIEASALVDCPKVELLYRKRNSLTYALNTKQGAKREVSWIMGLEGASVDGEMRRMMIHIGPDGQEWLWLREL